MNNLLVVLTSALLAVIIGFQLLRVWQYDARVRQVLKYRTHDHDNRAYATKTLLSVLTNSMSRGL